MTAFARTDVMKYVSAGGHVHERPVVGGEFVKVFALACPMCELELAGDPCWSQHPDLIPRTADEERRAQKLSDEGTTTMRQVAEALAMSAGKILHEQEQGQVAEAAKNAQIAAAAEAERAAAVAERAAVVREAQLREATRVAEAYMQPVQDAVPVPASGDFAMVVPEPVTKGIPDFPVDVHPSRKCRTCDGTLTRTGHATGRWPADCLDCRK
jgi:hypothetical protein